MSGEFQLGVWEEPPPVYKYERWKNAGAPAAVKLLVAKRVLLTLSGLSYVTK